MLYFLSSLFDSFLRVWKNRLVNKKNKLLASFINMLLYLFSALVVKFVVCNDLTLAMCVVTVNSFLGCWLAMWFDEKLDKRRQENEKESEE